MPTNVLHEIAAGIVVEKNGKAYIFSENGNFIAHEEYDLDKHIKDIDSELAAKVLANLEINLDYKNIEYTTNKIESINWTMMLYMPVSEAMADNNSFVRIISIGTVFVLLIVAVIFVIFRSIAKPIEKLNQDIQVMADCDMRIHEQFASVQYSKSKDEIGGISRALLKVKETFISTMTQVSNVAGKVAAFSERLTATSEKSAQTAEDTRKQFDVIAGEIDNTKTSVDKLNASGSRMEGTKNSLAEIIDNLSALAQENAVSSQAAATVERQTASAQDIAGASSTLFEMAQNMSDVISKFKI